MPSGPVPLGVSSKALASKEFSYIVQRAQIQQRKRAKEERRLKRQRALDAAATRAAMEEEQCEQGAHGEIEADSNILNQDGDGPENANTSNDGDAPDQNTFGDYENMDWGVQDNMDDYGGDENENDGFYNNDNDAASSYSNSPANDASYSQLCRAHVAAYMRGTHQYAQETNLTRRVTAWEDKLLPVLDDQFRRPQFDIHDCGAQLLDTLSLEIAENVNKVDEGSKGMILEDNGTSDVNIMAPQFIQLAKKQQSTRYEVCRLFLSMLQLANDRNVELMHDTVETLPENMLNMDRAADHLTDSLRVRLLSTQRHSIGKEFEMEMEAMRIDSKKAKSKSKKVAFGNTLLSSISNQQVVK